MTQLGLGGARLGSSARGAGWRASIRLVHAAIDHGVSFFDTADAYGGGTSERVLGRALRGRRTAVVVATKGGYRFDERGAVHQALRDAGKAVVGRLRAAPGSGRQSTGGGAYAAQDFSPQYLTTALEGSLRRLMTDHIDIYQLHGPRHAEPDAIAEWASDMVAAGKIGCLGVGAEDLDQASAWLGCPAIACVQLPFGVLDSEAGVDVIPRAHASGRRVLARGVLGAGLLADPGSGGSDNEHKVPLIEAMGSIAARSGRSVAALAVDFVRARPEVDTIVIGTRSAQHVGEVAAVLREPLPAAELLATIDAAIAGRGGSARGV